MHVRPVHNRAAGSPSRLLSPTILAIVLLPCIAAAATAQKPEGTLSNDLRDALEYFRLQKFTESAARLASYVDANPTDGPARRLLAQCYLKTGQPALAVRHLRDIQRLYPDDRETLELLNEANVALRAQREVEERRAKPEQVERWFVKAERLVREKKLKDAEEWLNRVLREQPEHAGALLRLAEVHSASGRYLSAIGLYKRLGAVHGSPRDLDLRLARNFAWGQRYGQACRHYARHLANAPEDTAVIFELAEAYRWSGRALEAIPAYRQVLEREPQHSAAHAGLAFALQEEGRHSEAVVEFDLALQNGAEGVKLIEARAHSKSALERSYTHAALEAQERGDYPEATRLLERLLSERSDDEVLLRRLAQLHSWSKNYPNALAYYDRFLKLQPDHLEARLERAEIFLWTGEFTAAQQEFVRVLESAPRHQRALQGMIHAHAWSGDLRGVEPFLLQLETVMPGHPLIREVRTKIESLRRSALLQRAAEAERNDLASAIQSYRQYIAQYGSERDLELRIARLHAWKREYRTAIDQYLVYLQRYPHDLVARLELADIQRWNAQYPAALQNYSDILSESPQLVAALVGRAEALYASIDDPIAARTAYRRVLAVDPRESLALQRYSEIREQLRPEVHTATAGITDSDGFARAWQQASISFVLPQRWRLSTIFRGGHSRQRRFVPGTNGSISSLNRQIDNLNGVLWGALAGIGVTRQRNNQSWRLEATAGGFHDGRASFNWAGEFSIATSERARFSAQFQHEEAGLELNTLASLVAGIKSDAARVQYQHELIRNVLFSSNFNIAHFSEPKRFALPANWRRGGDLRITYIGIPAIQIAYSYSAMSYTERSPVYFSPALYHAHRAEYRLRHRPNARVLLGARGSAGYGWIEGAGNFEFAVGPELSIRLTPRAALEAGYLFGGSQSSSFGSPNYRVHNFFLSLRFPMVMRTP